MANYIIVLSNKVQKQLDKLSDNLGKPIFEAIVNLKKNSRPSGCKKLKGRTGYRIRVANCRVIFRCN